MFCGTEWWFKELDFVYWIIIVKLSQGLEAKPRSLIFQEQDKNVSSRKVYFQFYKNFKFMLFTTEF